MADLIAPWELHPALVHFPIAFLIAAAVLDMVASRRAEAGRGATFLAVAGCITGLAAIVAGVIAWQTVPGHTEGAHALMTSHVVVQSIAMGLFLIRAVAGWRAPGHVPGWTARALGWMGALALVVGSTLGGHLVFREGVGVTGHRATSHEESDGGHAH